MKGNCLSRLVQTFLTFKYKNSFKEDLKLWNGVLLSVYLDL